MPVPPYTVSGNVAPRLNHPRVVSTVKNSLPGATLAGDVPAGAEIRGEPNTWPIWNVSLPAPPSSVVIAALSSTAK